MAPPYFIRQEDQAIQHVPRFHPKLRPAKVPTAGIRLAGACQDPKADAMKRAPYQFHQG
jgi:heterodisulfide reductase subunit A-like polyferredoxin